MDLDRIRLDQADDLTCLMPTVGDAAHAVTDITGRASHLPGARLPNALSAQRTGQFARLPISKLSLASYADLERADRARPRGGWLTWGWSAAALFVSLSVLTASNQRRSWPADLGSAIVDQDAFRDTYNAVNQRRCPYEKSILTDNCGCARARRFCIAEREGVHCTADDAQARCLELLEHLRSRARFALRTTGGQGALPHAKAMRVQVGGLRGVHAALTEAGDESLAPHKQRDGGASRQIDDVDALLRAASERFGGLAGLPYQRIIQAIAAYKGRQSFRERRRARQRAKDDGEGA